MEQLPPSVQKLLEDWRDECKVDMSDLSAELARVYQLQAKYLELWSLERMRLRSLKAEDERLRVQKFNHFLNGPTPETKDWDYPVSGKILRSDIPMWVDADKPVQDLAARLTICQTKVDTLTYILDTLKYRTNTIRTLIDREIWQSGN